MANNTPITQHAPSPAQSHQAQYYPEPPDYYGQQAASRQGLGLYPDDYRHSSPYDYSGDFRQGHSAYNSHYSTPPLTTSSEDPYDGIRTRSGRSLGLPTELKNLPRDSRPPRTKKPRPPKANKSNYPELDMVLSKLVHTYPDVEIEDMEAYVKRDPTERQRKAQEKKRTTPPRPMNSFMLYRHAYAETIKRFLSGKGNHQQVSYIAGKSWGEESAELRQRFHELAELEKENHNKAFPNYHFKPKKDTSNKKRKKPFGDDDEPSDFDDLESWGTPVSRNSSIKKPRPAGGFEPREYHPSPYYDHHLAPPPQMPPNRSSFEASNPGMTPPGSYPYQSSGSYMHRTTHPYSGALDSVQDVRYTHREPSAQLTMQSGMFAIPGGQHDLLYQTQPPASNMQFLDPRLSSWADSQLDSGQYDDLLNNTDLHISSDSRYPTSTSYYQDDQYHYEPESHSHPGDQTLSAPMGPWSLDGGDGLEGSDDLGFLNQ